MRKNVVLPQWLKDGARALSLSLSLSNPLSKNKKHTHTLEIIIQKLSFEIFY